MSQASISSLTSQFQEHCPLLFSDPPSSFSSYIHSANGFFRSVGGGLAVLGEPSVTSLLSTGAVKWQNYFSTSLLTYITVLLLLIAIVFIIAYIITIISCLSYNVASAMRRCLGRIAYWKYTEDIFSFKDTVFGQHIRSWLILCIVFGVCTLVFEVAYIPSYIISARVPEALRCQAAHLLYMGNNGTDVGLSEYYNDVPWFTMKRTDVQSFKGFKTFEDNIQDALLEINATSESFLLFLANFAALPSEDIQRVGQSWDSLFTRPAATAAYICGTEVSRNSPIMVSLRNKITTFVSYYDELRDTSEIIRSQFMRGMLNWRTSLDYTVEPVYVFGEVLQYILDNYTYVLEKVSLVPFIIALLQPLTVIFGAILFYKIQQHVKKNTKPNSGTYARLFGGFSLYLGLLSIIMTLITITLLFLLAFGQGGCSFVRKVVKDESFLDRYPLLREYMDNPERKRLMETCVYQKQDTRSNMVTVMDPAITDYIDYLKDQAKYISDEYFSYNFTPALEMTSDTLNMDQAESTIFINWENTTLFNMDNHFLVDRRYWEAVSYELPVSVRSDTFFASLGKEYDRVVRLEQEYQDSFISSDRCLDWYPNAVSVTTTRTFENLLTHVAAQVYRCEDLEGNFEIRICSEKGTKIHCSQSEVPDPITYTLTNDSIVSYSAPQFMQGYSTGLRTNEHLTSLFQKCIGKIIEGVPSCYHLYYNRAIVSLRILQLWEEEEWTCTSNFTLDQRVALRTDVSNIGVLFDNLKAEYAKPEYTRIDDIVVPDNAMWPVVPESVDNMECEQYAFAMALFLEGFCGGFLCPATISFIFFCLFNIFAIIAWFYTYKCHLYFMLQAKIIQEAINPTYRDLDDPATLIKFIQRNEKSRNHFYRFMTDANFNPTEITDENGSDLLHFATYTGDAEMVEYLLSRGSNVNRKNSRGYTPLSVAVMENHSDIAALLISKGANPLVRDEFGDTPLHTAARAGNIKCVEALCHPTAPPPVYHNDDDELAFDTALKLGHDDVVTFLGPLSPRS